MKISAKSTLKKLSPILFLAILFIFTACAGVKYYGECRFKEYEITLEPDEINVASGSSATLNVKHSLTKTGDCRFVRIVEVTLSSYDNPAGFTTEGCFDINMGEHSISVKPCLLTVSVPPGIDPGSHQIELVATIGDGYDYITDTEILKINVTND